MHWDRLRAANWLQRAEEHQSNDPNGLLACLCRENYTSTQKLLMLGFIWEPFQVQIQDLAIDILAYMSKHADYIQEIQSEVNDGVPLKKALLDNDDLARGILEALRVLPSAPVMRKLPPNAEPHMREQMALFEEVEDLPKGT